MLGAYTYIMCISTLPVLCSAWLLPEGMNTQSPSRTGVVSPSTVISPLPRRIV